MILAEKEHKEPTYIEKVYKSNVPKDLHLSLVLKREICLKYHKINEKLMEDL